jgi:hypothetical protein
MCLIFLCEAFGAVHGENSQEQIEDALHLHDTYCIGERVNHISSLLHSTPKPLPQLSAFQEEIRSVLGKLHLQVESKPKSFRAQGMWKEMSIPIPAVRLNDSLLFLWYQCCMSQHCKLILLSE